jgi:hypothetical protein
MSTTRKAVLAVMLDQRDELRCTRVLWVYDQQRVLGVDPIRGSAGRAGLRARRRPP